MSKTNLRILLNTGKVQRQRYIKTVIEKDFMKTRLLFLNAIADDMLNQHCSLRTVESYLEYGTKSQLKSLTLMKPRRELTL